MIVQLRRCQVVLRAIVFALPIASFAVATAVALWLEWPIPSRMDFWYLTIFTSVIWSATAERTGVTSITKISAENTGLYACTYASTGTFFGELLILFIARDVDYPRFFLLSSAATLFLSSLFVRSVFRVSLDALTMHRPPNRILMVGASRLAARAARRLKRNAFVRFRIVGYVHLPGEDLGVTDAPIFRPTDSQRLEDLEYDDIVVAAAPEQYGYLQRHISKLQILGKPIRILVSAEKGMKVRDRVLELGRLQMLDLDLGPTSSVLYFLVKRSFDFAFACTVLTFMALPMLVIAIAIKLASPGPVLFRQQRVGKNGRLFFMYKFRTMRVAPLSDSDTKWTTGDDPRRTRIGTWLRKTSLDEMPQFFNVLKGEMSVVGPRPERPHFVKQFSKEVGLYRARHHLNVGITGWAQVNGMRGNTSIARRVRYDLYYLQNWSLWFDLKIIVKTIFGGFTSKNAY